MPPEITDAEKANAHAESFASNFYFRFRPFQDFRVYFADAPNRTFAEFQCRASRGQEAFELPKTVPTSCADRRASFQPAAPRDGSVKQRPFGDRWSNVRSTPVGHDFDRGRLCDQSVPCCNDRERGFGGLASLQGEAVSVDPRMVLVVPVVVWG